ncbi:hypothetical protein TTRE_0000852701 [Trichuris trichiura]|uniref:Uncharacterized protein n=1 Tax=Trichuris trichiura TaxID=36087 RepID=A0A077ZKH6_TRITR|nr:hypothetical protein TTRE_0000852701 [Trichuris trichiura]
MNHPCIYRLDVITKIRQPMKEEEAASARLFKDPWLPAYEASIEAFNPGLLSGEDQGLGVSPWKYANPRGRTVAAAVQLRARLHGHGVHAGLQSELEEEAE